MISGLVVRYQLHSDNNSNEVQAWGINQKALTHPCYLAELSQMLQRNLALRTMHNSVLSHLLPRESV